MDRAGLLDVIARAPIIDHHAHNLLNFHAYPEQLLSVTSEASGRALQDAPSTLAHQRAVRQLCEYENITPRETAKESWAAYLAKRQTFEEDDFTSRSLKGLQTILVDDGIRVSSKVHDYGWHSRFTKSPAKRIVRIETLAEDLLVRIAKDCFRGHFDKKAMVTSFRVQLQQAIVEAIEDDGVAAFKSVVCYRTGLDIVSEWELGACTDEIFLAIGRARLDSPRIQSKPLNDYIVNMLAHRLEEWRSFAPPKPIQFHTGLGDNDLMLSLANPAFMQESIKAYPNIPIVLLHAAYPFTREAGYLASVYENVYLDIGEVFPMISRSGQEAVIRQSLEITPSTKLCWSTDGHFHQETYSLAIMQVREALKVVMLEMVDKSDIDYKEAVKIVKDILFETSNKLYGLRLAFELDSPSPWTVSPSVHTHDSAPATLKAFLYKNPGVKFIRVSWVDYASTVRTRVLRTSYILSELRKPNSKGSIAGIVTMALFVLPTDEPAVPDFEAAGECRLCPDFDNIRVHPRKNAEGLPLYASVMAQFQEQDGAAHSLCPRTILLNSIALAEQAGITGLKMGFEIEFCLFEANALRQENRIEPISEAHAWTSNRALHAAGGKALQILEEIMAALEECGIESYQFHAESAQGQYEIPLGPLSPLAAVDQLMHAREIVTYIASIHGYRATLYPRPFAETAGTGLHMHLSFPDISLGSPFFAGILETMPTICAFSLAGEDSYLRVEDGAWSGGTWCIWGDHNREAVLRRLEEHINHWEIKSLDGFANVYLAAAAILHAGRLGVQKKMHLPEPCNVKAGSLSSAERTKRGITQSMPRNLDSAIATFYSSDSETNGMAVLSLKEGDSSDLASSLVQEIGPEVCKRYRQVKEAEKEMLKELETPKEDETEQQARDRRVCWLMERY